MLAWKTLFHYNKGSFCFIHIAKKNMSSNRCNRKSWPAYLRSQLKNNVVKTKAQTTQQETLTHMKWWLIHLTLVISQLTVAATVFIVVVRDTIEERLDLGFVVFGFLLSAVENESAGETNNMTLAC